jgi:hypothetical protein
MTEKFEYPLKKDTKAAEENFFEILIEKKSNFGSNPSESRFKTVFLNGQWGGGKTQFIESVKSRHTYRHVWEKWFKPEKNIEHRKFVQLDLWEIEDSRTILAISFNKLFPLIYWTMKIIGVVLVALSIAVSPILGLNLLWFFNGHPIAKGIVSIALLGLGVWQFLKFKSDSIYKVILSSSKMSKFFKRKILYIDDFDRVSEKQQIEAYKVFNILNGKLPILFMGDYSMIQMVNEDNYLSKIIDERLELPVVLHSHYIIEEILNQFEKEFVDEDNIFSFENTFKDFILLEEHRALRELEQFCEMVNHEFITRGKQGRVQPYQQLLIIYVHMFYPRVYKKLAEFTQPHALNFQFLTAQELFKDIPDFPENKQDNENSIKITTDNPSDERICEVVNEMLSKNQNNIFPIPFLQNVKGYLLNESISNMNKSEANEILDKLENYPEILFGSLRDKRDDFVTFISQEYRKLPTYWTTDNDWMTSEYNQNSFLIKKIKLEKLVFKYIKENFDSNNLTELVVSKLSFAIYYEAKRIFEAIPGSQSVPRNVKELNKRTHCNISPNTIKVIADVEYILWNQYLHEFDLSEKIYFICIYKVGYARSTNSHFKDLLTKEVDIYIKDKFVKKVHVQDQKHEAYLYWLKCKSNPDNFYSSEVTNCVDILSVREYILFWKLMGLLVEKESNLEGIIEEHIIHLTVPEIYYIFNKDNLNYDEDDFMEVKSNIIEKESSIKKVLSK